MYTKPKAKGKKFYCSRDPDVEAVSFCEERDKAFRKGYMCEECKKGHDMMYEKHETCKPRKSEVMMCEKHPEQVADEYFCSETNTFYCPKCALNDHINVKDVSTVVKERTEDAERNCFQLESSIRVLKDREEDIRFELEGDENPDSLVKQMAEAMQKIDDTFKQLHAEVEQRRQTILAEIEKAYGSKKESLKRLIEDLENDINNGENAMTSYKSALETKNDAAILKEMIALKDEAEKAQKKKDECTENPIIPIKTECMFKGINELIKEISTLGEIVDRENIPPPCNFRPGIIMDTYVSFEWDHPKTKLPCTYLVELKINERQCQPFISSNTTFSISGFKKPTKVGAKIYTKHGETVSLRYASYECTTVTHIIILITLISFFSLINFIFFIFSA